MKGSRDYLATAALAPCSQGLLRLLVLQHELVDRCWRAENNDVARVFRMAQEIAFGNELESGRFDFLAQHTFLYAMEGFSNRCTVARFCRVISNQKKAAGLKRRKQLSVHLRAIDLHVRHVMISEKECDQIKITNVRRQRIVVVTNDMDDALHCRLLSANIKLVLDLSLHYLG